MVKELVIAFPMREKRDRRFKISRGSFYRILRIDDRHEVDREDRVDLAWGLVQER